MKAVLIPWCVTSESISRSRARVYAGPPDASSSRLRPLIPSSHRKTADFTEPIDGTSGSRYSYGDHSDRKAGGSISQSITPSGGGRGSFTTGFLASNVRGRGGLERAGAAARCNPGVRARRRDGYRRTHQARGVRARCGSKGGCLVRRYPDQPVSQPDDFVSRQFDRATRKPVEVPRVADSESFGFGIRVWPKERGALPRRTM